MNFSKKIFPIFLLGAGIFIGAFGYKWILAEPTRSNEIHQYSSIRNKLTNPLLACRELPESISIKERIDLHKEVENLIKINKNRKIVSQASIYFRDLNNGPWFGIGEAMKFSPASLLKVPLALDFYSRANSDPNVLHFQIEYIKGNDNYEAFQPYGPKMALTSGKIYSVQELIELMLKESSNEAALVLAEIAGIENIQNVYKNFGFTQPEIGKDYLIDVHTFASFFRTLYNATYLSRSFSEEILSIMTQSAFNEGIEAGVPTDVKVAHKFGARGITGQMELKQLHDCGIVYHPKTPYILCVMTQGNDYEKLAKFIKEVSKLVYDSIK